MTTGPRRRPRRATGLARRAAALRLIILPLLLAALLAGWLPATARAAPATTADSAFPVVISVSAVNPVALRPGSELSVAGSLRNTGRTALNDVQINLRLDWVPLTDRRELAEWSRLRPGDAAVGGVQRRIPLGQPLPAGQSAPFSITVPVNALGLPATAAGFGPRRMSVEIQEGTRRVGMVRTFVVWNPVQRYAPTQVAVLVPLTAGNTPIDADGNGGQAAQLWRPNGRLTRLLGATATDSGFSYAIDPALLAAASAAQKATPPPTSGTPTPGAGSAAPSGTASSGTTSSGGTSSGPTQSGATPSGSATATRARRPAPGATPFDPVVAGQAASWLSALAAARTGRDMLTLPYGDPDVSALATTDHPELLTLADGDAQTVTTQVFGRALPGGLVWPASAHVDADTVALAAQDGHTLILPASALATAPMLGSGSGGVVVSSPADGGTAVSHVRLPTDRQDADTVVTDDALGQAMAAAGGPEPVLAAQRLLAETAAITAAHPVESPVVLAVLPRDWNPDPSGVQAAITTLRTAPWAHVEPLSALRAEPAVDAARTRLTRGPAPELSPQHVQAVAGQLRRLRDFTPALTRQGPAVSESATAIAIDPVRRSALELLSVAWIPSQASAGPALAALARDVDRLYQGITVVAGSSANLLASSGQLPVTVANQLDVPVTVILQLHPTTRRVVVKRPIEVHLDAGKTSTVRVELTAVANGEVQIQSYLTTPGPRPTVIGTAPTITVHVHRDWESRGLVWVGLLLALLLVAGLIRSVRRGRVRVPPEAVPDPDDVWRGSPPPPAAGELDQPAQDQSESEPAPSGPDSPAQASPTSTSASRLITPGTGPGRPADSPGPAEASPERPRAMAGRPALAARSDRSQVIVVGRPEVALEAGALEVHPCPTRPQTESATAVRVGVPPQRVALSTSRPPTPSGDRAADRDAPDSAPVSDHDARGGWQHPGPDDTIPMVIMPGHARPGGLRGTPPDPDSGAGGGGTNQLLSSSAWMAGGTLVSRVLGMLRVAVLAWAIGVGFEADPFAVANTLPNNLFILIGGGVLNAVLVPQIVRAAKHPDGGQNYIDRLITLAVVILGTATLVATLASPALIRMYEHGWDAERITLATGFALWCLPQIFFYGMYTIYGQVLNARGSFGPYMWAPVVNNVVAIAGCLVFIALYGAGPKPVGWWGADSIAVLAATATAGVVAQALVLVPVLSRTGYRWHFRWGARGIGLRPAGRVAAWTFAAVAIGQLGFILISQAATYGGIAAAQAHQPGRGRTVYDNAYLLFFLPHSLAAVSLVTAVFTRMAIAAGAGRTDQVRTDVSLAVRLTGVATVLATVGFIVLGRDLARAVFFRNSPVETDSIALVTALMMLGLVAFSAQYLFQRVFYAYEDARTPFLIQLGVILVWTAGSLLAAATLPGTWVVPGIALAMSVSNLVGLVIAVLLLRRRIGGLDGARVLRTYVQLLLAALLAGFAAWLVDAGTHALFGFSRPTSFLALAMAGSTLLLCYAGGLRAMRVRELDLLLAPLRGRLAARRS